MKINVTISRYRIYQVLKWIFAVFAFTIYLNLLLGIIFIKSNPMASELTYLSIVTHFVIAIFFKLQEDSNKPTVEE